MKPPYRVIVVDDEPLARKIVEGFVKQVPDLETVAVCANARQALDAIQRLKPNLVFLDIQMPEMTGMELMAMPLADRPEYVLTTAYANYAVQSYDFKALDYLMKPIAFERFMEAVVKFLDKHRLSGSFVQPGLIGSSTTDDSLWLRVEKNSRRVRKRNILYVKGETNYVMVYLDNGKRLLTHMSMAGAEDLFLPPDFLRIHKSYIVRLSAIEQIEGNTITLENNTQLTIGPKYREKLREFIPIIR